MASPIQAPFEVECEEVEIVETPEIIMVETEVADNDEPAEEEIYVGKTFGTFEALEDFMRKFERDHKQKFWIRSSRSVEAARKILKRPLSESIRYYELQYSCIHGGLDFKSRGKGIRNMSTHKMNCPAKIKLRATPDGNKLEIRSFVAVHEGHTMSEDVFQLLPQNRRHSSKNDRLRKFLTVDYPRGKKRRVPADMIDDIVKQEALELNGGASEESEHSSEITKSLSVLKYDYGAHTMVLYDDENTFKGLFFHTDDMKKSLLAWPEVVYIWNVPNWLRRDHTVVLFSVKDSNGMHDVVGVTIVCGEDKDSLHWFLQAFRNVFSAHERLPVKCIFSYAALVENELQTIFPEVETRVSTHYSIRSFNRMLTAGKFVVSNKEREICIKLFSKMLFCKTHDEYKILSSLFRKVAPAAVAEYFQDRLEPTEGRWAVYNFPPSSFVDLSKSQKEMSLDNRMKQVIPKDSTILTFLRQLLKWLDSLRSQTIQKTSVHILKKPVHAPSKGSWQDSYSSHLTQYAFTYVSQQMALSSSVSVVGETEEGLYIVQEDSNCFCVGPVDCQCVDWRSMRLPCRHVLSVRIFLSVPCFSEELCDARWTKQYYLDHRLEISAPAYKSGEIRSGVPALKSEPHYSEKAVSAVETLLRIMHDDQLESRIQTVEKIAQTWALGYEVVITSKNPLAMEEQEVVEEEVCFDDHDPEVPVSTKKETAKACAGLAEMPRTKIAQPTIVEKSEAEKMSCASVVMEFNCARMERYSNPVKFLHKSLAEKVAMTLKMISKSRELTDEALKGNYVLTDVDIELDPTNIRHSILHEWVDLSLLEDYLEPPALEKLRECVQEKRTHQVWQCFICELDLDDDCVLCCSCLLWFHPKCVGLPSPHKRKVWYCYSCHRQAART